MSRYSMIFHDIEGLWRNNLASSHPPEPFQTFIQVAFLYQSSTRGWTSVHRLLAGCTENLGTPWNTYSTNSKTIQTIPNHPEPFQQQHIKSFNLSKKSKTFKDHFNKVPLKKSLQINPKNAKLSDSRPTSFLQVLPCKYRPHSTLAVAHWALRALALTWALALESIPA